MPHTTLATSLVDSHGTRDPFQIAHDFGIIIIETPLEGVRGFYQSVYGQQIIYVDNRLPELERLWVCAHELGHAMLHSGLNRLFMDRRTHMISSRYEVEADRFAVDLLVSDDDLLEICDYPISTVAQCLGVSPDIAEYRLSGLTK